MRSSFGLPEYTSGVTAEVKQPQPNTEDREWGEVLSDTAIDALARPVVGALRTGAQMWRGAEDDPRGFGAAVERGLGAVEEKLMDWRSDRATALDTQSIDPRGDERSYWREPFVGAAHAFMPSVPYAAAAVATGGLSLAARAATAAGMGVFGAGEAVNDLRTYTDTEPLQNLKQSPVFEKLLREYDGDELAARNALFKEMFDPKSQAVNWLVNTLEVPAFRMGMRPTGAAMRIASRAKAAGVGAVTGAAQGAAEGSTEAYIQQLGLVRAGQQQAIDPDKITSGAMSGAIFGGPMAAFHAVAPQYKVPPTVSQRFGQHVEDFVAFQEGRATPLGTTEQSVASQQINPEAPVQAPPAGEEIVQPTPPTGGAPPPPPPPPPRPQRPVRQVPRAGREEVWSPMGPNLPREQAGPPREQFGPERPQPELPVGPMVWSGPSGFNAQVTVMDQPAVFQNEQWMQPVSYTNPGTGRTQTMLAPVEELRESFGPREQFGPEDRMGPHQPPEQFGPPRPPEQFGPPEYFGPNLPTEQAGPPRLGYDRDIVRGALATIGPKARNNLAARWGAILKERPLNITDVPESVRDQMDAGEWDAVSTMMETEPELMLGILQRRGTGGFAENALLQDLQLRQRRRADTARTEQEARQREAQEAELERQTRPAPRRERAGIHFTGLERTLDAAIAAYHRKFATPARLGADVPGYVDPTAVSEQQQQEWASLRTRAQQLEQLRYRNGLPPANFLAELGPQPGSPEARARTEARAHREQLARTEAVRTRRLARQEVVETRKERAEQRAARRAERPTGFTRHPLMGGQTYENQLRSDVEAYNKRVAEAKGKAISRAAQSELDIDRRVLQERVDTFNAGAEPGERLSLDRFERPATQREKLQQEFDALVDQLEQVTPAEMRDPGRRPHLMRLVNRLINLQRGRQFSMIEGERPREMTVREALRRRGPEVVSREEKPRIAVWTAGERWEDLAKEVQKRQQARRKAERAGRHVPTHVAIGEGEYIARFGRLPVDTILIAEPTRSRTKLAISPALATQLERYGLVSTPEGVAAASARSQEETQLLREARERQAAAREAAKPTRGRKPTGTGPAETEGLTKKEARRAVSQALKARKAEEYKSSGKAPGRRTGMSGEVWTRIFRQSWKELPGWQKIEIRRSARLQGVKIEDRIREIVEEREADARERARQGLPPLHPFGKLPTVAEALEQYRQGMRRETGRQATAGTEAKYVAARERVIKQSVETSIAKRFGTEKRFREFVAKLHEDSQVPRPVMPATGRTARPNRLEMNVYHERLRKWQKHREDLAKRAGQLKTFLDHTIQQINKDLAGYRSSMGIKGRGSLWRLAEPLRTEEGLAPGEQQVGGRKQVVKLDRKKFRSGKVGEDPDTKEATDEYARYNFANDMQNMSEGIRWMQAHLANLGPALRWSAPLRTGRQAAGVPRASTQFEEFNRYTAPLNKELRDFTANMQLFLSGELKLIEEDRKERSREVEAGYRGVTMEQRGRRGGEDTRRQITGLPEDVLVEQDYEADLAGSEYSIAQQQDVEAATAIAERETSGVVGQRAIEQAGRAEQQAAEPEKQAARREPFEIIPAGLNPEPVYDPITGEERVADIHAVPSRELRPGGGRAAVERGVNIVETQMLDNAVAKINRRAALAKLRAERTGRVHDPDAIARETAERLKRDFPLRSERLKYTGKVRPGMAPMGPFDEKGLPVDRLSPHEEFTEYSPAEQYMIEAWDELNNLTTPEHPLITPAAETQAVLDRVKAMVAQGQTGIVPREYVTDEFLNRLAAITADTEVYHAPYDATSYIGDDSPAHYNTRLDRVVLPSDVSPEFYVRAALHETSHAATERSLLTDPSFFREVKDLMQRAIDYAKRQGVDLDYLPRDLYGLTNPGEFIAEVMSNKNFREFLFRVPAPTHGVIQGVKNVLNALYRTIRDALRRAFGNAKDGDTALDILFYDQSTVLGQTDAMIKRTMKQLERHGRPDRAVALQALGEGDGRRYLSLSEGARAFRDGLGQMFGRAAFQVQQIKNENRAPGMGWRTMFDQTRIGSPEFKALTNELFETFERVQGAGTKMRDSDKQKIAELAGVWNKWTKDGRRMAGEFMIAEGEHTAFADADLGVYGPEYLDQETGQRRQDLIGKNAHIDPTLLKNAQVVQMHDRPNTDPATDPNAGMVQRLRYVENQLPGFKEFREKVYAFTAARENEVRRNNIRDMWAVSDYMPDGLSVKDREALLSALRDWTDPSLDAAGKKKYPLSTADQKRLRDAGFFKDPEKVAFRDKLQSVKEFQPLLGPYSPFTRYGDWALSGTFKIDKPDNAILLKEDVNEATGEPADDARYVFKSEEEARDMVREMSKEENGGLVQLDGGKVWIDKRTGERPRLPDHRHRNKERLATQNEIERAQDAAERKKMDPEIADLLNPRHLREYYFVTFQPKLLTMEPNQYTADQNMRAFKAKYRDKLDITKPKDVFLHDGRQNEHYTSTQMKNLMNHVRASSAYQRLDGNEQAAISRNMNLAAEKFIQRRGFQQRFLPRNYVKGATTHVLASLDDYSSTSAHYLAKKEFSSLLGEQSEDIKKYLKANEYAAGNSSFVAENRVYQAMMRRLHHPTRNPHETFISRGIDRGLRITMLDKLPNVAYFTINGTETAIIGGPLMSGRHNVVDVGKTIGKYYRVAGVFGRFRKAAQNDIAQAFKRGNKMTDFTQLYGDALDQAAERGRAPFAEGQKRLIQRAADRNLFDKSASLEYQSSFPTDRKWVDVWLDYGQGVFQAMNTAIENMGRFATLTSAYDLEMRRLLRVAEGKAREHNSGEAQYTNEQREKAAGDYAINILHQANGVYANYNAPEMFTREGPLGLLGPVIFQFKKWPQRVTMIYLRSGLGMVNGIFKDWAKGNKMTPEHREAARQFIYMVAMVGLVAGAMGLPLEPFSHTINLAYIMGISRYNWDDVNAGFRTWVARQGGGDLAQLVAHGPLSYFTGLDIGRRLSQADMWASGSPGSNKPRDLNASLMGLLGGAMLGTANETLTGVQKMGEGFSALSNGADAVAWKKFGEGMRHVIPFRLASDAIGSFVGAEGTELASGRKLGSPYTPFEQAGRFAGFVPTREAEAREARAAITSADKRSQAGRKALIDQFTRSPAGAQRSSVWQSIQENWNPYHPGYEITQSDLLKADVTLRKARAAPINELGVPQTKRNAALMPMAEAYGFR